MCNLAQRALDDKSCPLSEMIDVGAVRKLMNNPDSMTEPWYGQLMQVPQVLAYIYQIYVWIKNYNVEFEL